MSFLLENKGIKGEGLLEEDKRMEDRVVDCNVIKDV